MKVGDCPRAKRRLLLFCRGLVCDHDRLPAALANVQLKHLSLRSCCSITEAVNFTFVVATLRDSPYACRRQRLVPEMPRRSEFSLPQLIQIRLSRFITQ